MFFIDVHAHIDQHDPAELPGIMQRARQAGVGAVISAGVTIESSERCVRIAHQHPDLFAGTGVHPEDMTRPLNDSDLGTLRRLASDERVVAMSEAGLDHTPPEQFRRAPGSSWVPSTGEEWWPVQEEAFRAQIGIARDLGLAVIFHNRGANDDTLRVLKDERAGELGCAAHYFQGSWEYARALLDLGAYVSLAKPLLRLPELRETVRRLPLDRIVFETDAFPQPYKGDRSKWTEPADIPLIAAKVANLHRISVDKVREITTSNALNLLGEHGRQLAGEMAM